MDYDRRRTDFRSIFFYLLYVVGVVYLLLTNNRYLYSHRELGATLVGAQREAVSPVPRVKADGTESVASEVKFWNRSSPERTGAELASKTHDKDFVAEWAKPVVEAGGENEIQSWAADDSGVYLTGASALAFNADGEPKWKFHFADRPGEPTVLEPMIDENQIYLARTSGQLVTLNKTDGSLRWKLDLAEEILSAPLPIQDELWVAIKPLATERQRLEEDPLLETKANRKLPNLPPYRLARVRRSDGQLIGYSEPLPIKGKAEITWARELNQILLTAENRFISVNMNDGKIVLNQTVPDPIKGPAVIFENKVYLSLASGKIQAWDIGKKGKFDWEVDIAGPPQTAPTYIPTFHRLAVLTSDSHLHMVDIKKAEHLWSFPIENRNPNREIVAARLSGRYIEKLGMKWEKRGWTAWAPCSDNRICIYNPDKGQLLSRILANGTVLTPPLFVGKGFYLVTANSNREGRRFTLSYFTDEETFKKKSQAAAKAAANPTGNANPQITD